MKQFSIHKVNKPMMRAKAGASDDEEATVEGDNGQPEAAAFQEHSLLTAEEREALQPKEIKVVNPWIHEATHKEYLEAVKVSASTT
jgi:hypothetical protein